MSLSHEINLIPPSSGQNKIKSISAALFMVTGVGLLLSVIFPILNFQLSYSSRLAPILSPLSSNFYNYSNVLGDTSQDYTDLNNWFIRGNSSDKPQIISSSHPQNYTISIPKLKVDSAVVTFGGNDLKSSLIHYSNTALPGQLGSPVVFGHSVLPQFFNPKSYTTIFSTLFKLEEGDEVFVDFDNVRYRYLVDDMYEVSASDLSVLEQRFDSKYLTLVTCSPPGTYLRRLVVKARIVDI